MFKIWEDTRKPLWDRYLEEAPNYVIDETGLNREELRKVLQVLYDNRIIN
jgi:transcription initiation factor IIE alpha subunit